MENHKERTKRGPDVAALIAGAIALVATVIWVVLWMAPLPDESEAQHQTKAAPLTPPQAIEPEKPPVAEGPPAAPPTPLETPPAPPSAPAVATREKPAPPQQTAQLSAAKPEAAAAAAASAPAPQAKSPEPPPTDRALAALPGRYVGNYFEGGSEAIGMTLTITSVERGVVEGTASLGGQGCSGDYPMRGSYRSSKLELRATRNGGPAGDCPLRLSLGVDGARLTGTTGSGNGVELSK